MFGAQRGTEPSNARSPGRRPPTVERRRPVGGRNRQVARRHNAESRQEPREGRRDRRPRDASTRSTRRARSSRRPSSPSSTRRSTSRSVWASIQSTPTRWSAARSCCRTAPVRPSACSSSPRVRKSARHARRGADFVGSDDMVAKVQRRLHGLRSRHRDARHDGRRSASSAASSARAGSMPNPKVGTVTFDVGNAVTEAKAGKVEYRVEKAGIVHARIGKVSFTEEALARRTPTALIRRSFAQKPSTAKGIYLRSITRLLDHGPRRAGSTRCHFSGARPRRRKPWNAQHKERSIGDASKRSSTR